MSIFAKSRGRPGRGWCFTALLGFHCALCTNLLCGPCSGFPSLVVVRHPPWKWMHAQFKTWFPLGRVGRTCRGGLEFGLTFGKCYLMICYFGFHCSCLQIGVCYGKWCPGLLVSRTVVGTIILRCAATSRSFNLRFLSPQNVYSLPCRTRLRLKWNNVCKMNVRISYFTFLKTFGNYLKYILE